MLSKYLHAAMRLAKYKSSKMELITAIFPDSEVFWQTQLLWKTVGSSYRKFLRNWDPGWRKAGAHAAGCG